jgi:hypothetical protein
MLKYSKYISKVLEEVLPVEPKLSDNKPSQPKNIDEFFQKLENLKKKTPAGQKTTGFGVKLDQNNKFITIQGQTGEEFELTLAGNYQNRPLYFLKTQDKDIQKQSTQNYFFVEDSIYQSIMKLYENLNLWRTQIEKSTNVLPSAPTTPTTTDPNITTPNTTDPNTTNTETNVNASKIFTFSEMIKLYETNISQSKMTTATFDNSVLSYFANTKVFNQRYPNYQEVGATLLNISKKYPALYNKTYSEFLQLKNKIQPSAKKDDLSIKWYINKLDENSKPKAIFFGEEIKSGDTVYFTKFATKTKFSTTTFKVKNALVNKAEIAQNQNPTF